MIFIITKQNYKKQWITTSNKEIRDIKKIVSSRPSIPEINRQYELSENKKNGSKTSNIIQTKTLQYYASGLKSIK